MHCRLPAVCPSAAAASVLSLTAELQWISGIRREKLRGDSAPLEFPTDRPALF